MKFNDLKVSKNKKSRRLGRGISAGLGKTAGRGTKGQKARTGSSKRPGFAGGQNPLMQQLPKLPGFNSHRQKAEIVSLSQLETIESKLIDAQILADNRLISNPYVRIKLVGSGAVKSAKSVKLPAASAQAVTALNKTGGEFIKVERLKRSQKSSVKQD